MNNKSANFSVNDAIKEYLPLMHELVIRLDLVAMACDGKLNLTPIYAREYSYLQFRYMCELIALGCLQLHGDLPVASGKSRKGSNPDTPILRTEKKKGAKSRHSDTKTTLSNKNNKTKI